MPKTPENGVKQSRRGLKASKDCLYEQSMPAEVHGDQLSRTKYFPSRDCENGQAWLRVQNHVWPVRLPRPPRLPPHRALAQLVCDDDELEGRRWRLGLPHRSVPETAKIRSLQKHGHIQAAKCCNGSKICDIPSKSNDEILHASKLG